MTHSAQRREQDTAQSINEGLERHFSPGKPCCSKCIIPLDYKPPQCNDGECECHVSQDETGLSKSHTLVDFKGFSDKESQEEAWERQFLRKFFVYKLGGEFPDHVGAEKEAIDFIAQLLHSQSKSLLERVRAQRRNNPDKEGQLTDWKIGWNSALQEVESLLLDNMK